MRNRPSLLGKLTVPVAAVGRACRVLGGLALSLGVSGCAFPSYTPIRSETRFTVRDEAGAPIGGAEVFLLAIERRSLDDEVATKRTDENGIAEFESKSQWRTAIFGMPDSSVYYYRWEWCVRRAGFQTAESSFERDTSEVAVTLRRGEPSECRYVRMAYRIRKAQ